MIIAVEGTKGFTDYETFMRAMGVALSQPNNENVIETGLVKTEEARQQADEESRRQIDEKARRLFV